MSGSVLCDYQGPVAVLRLSDARTLNAMSTSMVTMFRAAMDEAIGRCRAIVVTGDGRGFCSGANLGGDLNPEALHYDAGLVLETHFNPLMRALRDCPLPIVSAVNGVAAGIGCALALTADIVVAADTAYFVQAFQAIGLVPDGGSASQLIRSIGRARALEMMLLGEKIPAVRALEWGLINRVVKGSALGDDAMDLAQRLARGPSAALSMIRRQAWLACERDYDEMLAIEREFQKAAGNTLDHREGVAAFLAKRPASFVDR